jgi:hypothetical protein
VGLARYVVVTVRQFRPILTLAGVLVLLSACDRVGRTGDAGATDSADGDINMPSFPMRAQPPYEEVEVTSFGSLAGEVVTAPRDTAAVRPAGPCAAGGEASSSGEPLVVWLDDIRRGRRLGETRRYQVVATQCSFDPEIQVAYAGGTLNVRNFDRTEHEVHFHRSGFRRPLLEIPFALNGQLVPTTTLLLQPGMVEVRTSQDTTLRAYIFVVDHPYVAIVKDGRFAIDSIPAGRYTLRAWSPSAVAEVPVEVPGNGAATARLELR